MLRSHPIFVSSLSAAILGAGVFGISSVVPWVILAVVAIYGVTHGLSIGISGLNRYFDWLREWIPSYVRVAVRLLILVIAVITMLLAIRCSHGTIEFSVSNLGWISLSIVFGLLWPYVPQFTVTKASELLAAFEPPLRLGEGCLRLTTTPGVIPASGLTDSPFRPPRFTSRAIYWRARIDR